MLQMNKMQDYVTKLRERGVPEQTALNRASDKMLKYWFKQIEQQGDHHQTEENSSYRVRRDVNDDDDNDPENPYHDPKNPFHFRRKLEDVINKLAEENNTAEVERWQDKINRANIAQKEYFEYVDKRPHDDNITIIVGYDHPGHGEHMARMATYEKVLSKKGLESHIVANKVADKHFAYWLKMVDNKTFANPRIHERKTLPPEEGSFIDLWKECQENEIHSHTSSESLKLDESHTTNEPYNLTRLDTLKDTESHTSKAQERYAHFKAHESHTSLKANESHISSKAHESQSLKANEAHTSTLKAYESHTTLKAHESHTTLKAQASHTTMNSLKTQASHTTLNSLKAHESHTTLKAHESHTTVKSQQSHKRTPRGR
ncbi:hypothetical protein WDU94_002924 [Cyamophila willieti]